MSEDTLRRLAALLESEGGLMATLVAPVLGDGAALADGDGRALADGDGRALADGIGPAQVAAMGPRTEERAEEYELLVEAIYEGYLLHYGSPRVVQASEPDLRLLAGDQLYAIGLARLVALGDAAAVAELADTITLSALAQGSGDPDLADAVWTAGARAVGWGSTEGHRQAKSLAFAGAPGAFEAMRTSAVGVAASP
jgi:hypothetical protein